MSTEANKALVRHIIEEVLIGGRVDRVDDYFSGDFVQFGRRVGPGQFRALVTALHTAFPDLRGVVEHLVAEGDLVVCDLTVQGMQRGPFPFPQVGILPPTGRSYRVKHCHWWRVVDGKIAEHWAVRDDLGQLTQSGHLTLPTPSAT
jgi:predicted ester cyclase